MHGFLGRNKADNYEDFVETLLQTYCKLGSRMSLKILVFSLRFFQVKFGRCEHGERFHQDIQVMEKRYKSRWDEAMMGDYVWTLIRDDKRINKRKCRPNVHF